MTATCDHASNDFYWTTDALEPDHVLSSWMELLSSNITEMQVDGGDEHAFRASWRHMALGPIDLNFLEASPQRVQRTPDMIRRQRSADYDLLYMRRGPARLTHCGEHLQVPQGSFVLLNNLESYDLVFPDGSVCLTTHFDDRWLRKWVASPRALTARPIDGNREWGAPLAATLRTIADIGLEGAALPRSAIADQFGALLALMAGENGSKGESRHQDELLGRLHRTLKDRFDDCDLDPAAVANEMGISKRYLHGLFARSGTTFGAELLSLRLGRAAEILIDARYAHYRISDIAWACGFADPSHFARRFKERFIASPIDYRKRAHAANRTAFNRPALPIA